MDLTEYRRKGSDKNGRCSDDDVPLSEKWVVALVKNPSIKRLILREFYAQGYYEAFDIVMSYTERTKMELVWFKEKRRVGYPACNVNFPSLEFVCTYCNVRCSEIDLIPCVKVSCNSHFCCKKCLDDHLSLRRHDF